MCALHLEQDPLRHSGAQVMHGLAHPPKVGTPEGRQGRQGRLGPWPASEHAPSPTSSPNPPAAALARSALERGTQAAPALDPRITAPETKRRMSRFRTLCHVGTETLAEENSCE